MCIVSIFSDGEGNFILTQNRDESIFRPTSDEIITREKFHQNFTGPVDLVYGGTWIFYSDQMVCCILNGGYLKHSHRPPYRLSRGLILLETLKSQQGKYRCDYNYGGTVKVNLTQCHARRF